MFCGTSTPSPEESVPDNVFEDVDCQTFSFSLVKPLNEYQIT